MQAGSIVHRTPARGFPLTRSERPEDGVAVQTDTFLIAEDPVSQATVARVKQLAASDVPILITGETGTGKELLARYAHSISARRHRPFLPLDASALSEPAGEGEQTVADTSLFAPRFPPAWLRWADGGTLFVDEIGDLSIAMQGRLLRLLERRSVSAGGVERGDAADVRLIAASRTDLPSAVRAGRFRGDLLYRVGLAVVELPPLRARSGDILPLARHFLRHHGEQLGRPGVALSPAAEMTLRARPWPGNVREVENAIQHALLASGRSVLEAEDVWPTLLTEDPREVSASLLRQTFLDLLHRRSPELHQSANEILLRTAFEFCDRNQVQTARALGISRNVLRAALAGIGLAPKRRRPTKIVADAEQG